MWFSRHATSSPLGENVYRWGPQNLTLPPSYVWCTCHFGLYIVLWSTLWRGEARPSSHCSRGVQIHGDTRLVRSMAKQAALTTCLSAAPEATLQARVESIDGWRGQWLLQGEVASVLTGPPLQFEVQVGSGRTFSFSAARLAAANYVETFTPQADVTATTTGAPASQQSSAPLRQKHRRAQQRTDMRKARRLRQRSQRMGSG